MNGGNYYQLDAISVIQLVINSDKAVNAKLPTTDNQTLSPSTN